MSYILDALRKADAERDRGNVPGIHAQPSFAGGLPGRSQPAPKPWLWLGAGALAVAVIAAIAWFFVAPSSRGAAEAGAPANPSAPQALAPAAMPPAPMAPPPVGAAPVAPAPPPRLAAAPAPAAVRKPKPPAGSLPTLPNPAAPKVATAPADTQPAATGERIYTLNELPEDIRRQLPNIVVGGSMYSSRPADRILILNGQVAHEGDKIGNDLVLQQIRLKSAVLNFKGYRYALNF